MLYTAEFGNMNILHNLSNEIKENQKKSLKMESKPKWVTL